MEYNPVYMLTHMHYSGIPALVLLALLVWTSIEAILGRLDRAKRLAKWVAITAIVAWIVYTIPFVMRDYTLEPVYESTSLALPAWLLPATTWSTSGGSLYLFTVIAAIGFYLVARSLGENRNARLYLAAAPWIPILVLFSALFYGAFALNPHPEPTGMGLNPLLKSFWLYPHPVTTFSGYALLAVTGLAIALGLRSRSITVVYEIGWALLTIGIMLGGYWSYETFGWGGYWAWDPVETSELMVWLAATTLPHVMVALPSLTRFNAALLSSTVYLAMFATRTGLSPLHSFASAGIAALILLASSIVLLVYSFYLLSLDLGIASIVGEVRRWIRTPTMLGLGIASVTLLAATFFVTGSLLYPSLRVAAGLPATVPTMGNGVRFYHPVLYPISIALLAGITIAFIGDRLGWRGTTALLASESLLAAILAYRVEHGMLLAPFSPIPTNMQMAVGIVFAGVALASTLAFIFMRAWRGLKNLVKDRYFGIALIHVGFILTLLGVYMGGTYAFNQSYFQQYSLKPGDAIQLPGGKLLVFKGFKYGIIDEPVDIFTPYAGRFPTYMLAQDALLTLHSDIASLYSQYIKGERVWNSPPLRYFRSILNKTLDLNIVKLCPHGCNMTLAERPLEMTGHGTNLVLHFSSKNATLVFRGVHVWFQLEPWQTNEGLRGLVAAVYMNVTNATLIAPDIVKEVDLGPHVFYLAALARPTNITLPGVGVLEVRAVSFFSLPESLRRHEAFKTNTSVVFGRVLAYVVDGVLYGNGTRVNIGISNPYPASAALYMMIEDNKIFKNLMIEIGHSSLAKLLENPSNILHLANYTECPVKKPVALQLSTSTSYINQGCVEAPKFVPATAYVKLIFEIVDKNGARLETIPAVLRYEVNGEIQGIHGLVSKVIHASVGVTDVYIAVHPPTIIANTTFLLPTGEAYQPVFHDLVVYYLHEAFKKIKDPGKRLVLAALLAAGLHIDDPTMRNPQLASAILEADTIGLYLLAEHYNVSRSPILLEGINVEVKLVPGAPFVWAGPTIMALAAVMAAVADMLSRRS